MRQPAAGGALAGPPGAGDPPRRLFGSSDAADGLSVPSGNGGVRANRPPPPPRQLGALRARGIRLHQVSVASVRENVVEGLGGREALEPSLEVLGATRGDTRLGFGA